MRHHDHRHTLLGKLGHGGEHLPHHLRVECGGWLVEKHDLRVHGECAGDGNALLLAAGQLSRVLVRLCGNTDAVEQLKGFLLSVGLAHFQHFAWRKGDVIQNA